MNTWFTALLVLSTNVCIHAMETPVVDEWAKDLEEIEQSSDPVACARQKNVACCQRILNAAVKAKKSNLIAPLAQAGIHQEIVDRQNKLPLDYALENGDFASIDELFKYGLSGTVVCSGLEDYHTRLSKITHETMIYFCDKAFTHDKYGRYSRAEIGCYVLYYQDEQTIKYCDSKGYLKDACYYLINHPTYRAEKAFTVLPKIMPPQEYNDQVWKLHAYLEDQCKLAELKNRPHDDLIKSCAFLRQHAPIDHIWFKDIPALIGLLNTQRDINETYKLLVSKIVVWLAMCPDEDIPEYLATLCFNMINNNEKISLDCCNAYTLPSSLLKYTSIRQSSRSSDKCINVIRSPVSYGEKNE